MGQTLDRAVKTGVLGLIWLAVPLSLLAQPQARIWVPEGYRLLTVEERQSLSAQELKAIGERNQALLREALDRMSPEEQQAIVEGLQRASQDPQLSLPEKQYATMASMLILSLGMQRHEEQQRNEEKARFQKLLRDQEETTKGFPGDQKSVEAEASAVEALFKKEDSRKLYLRILRPLRARPWNDSARVVFRRLVRADSQPTQNRGTLYDAALAFVREREAETSEEGSWFSLEAFLRLSLRGEVPEAKKLFATAIAKNSRDIESYLYPLLIADIEGSEAERVRLRERARKEWLKEEDLDLALFRQLPFLPPELQVRARTTFEKRYKGAHPTDWPSRLQVVAAGIQDGRLQEVENEATTLLALPLSALPEPYRTEFLALKLRAMAGSGKCGEVAAEIARLEASAEAAYPRQADPYSSPRPRTIQNVVELRASLSERGRDLEKLKAALADGSLEKSPEWRDVPKEQRRDQAKEWISQLEKDTAEMDSLLEGRDDAAVASMWSRRELADWEKAHNIVEEQDYDLYGEAERLSILVRSAQGKCFLAKRKPAAAVEVLKPCVGGGRNYHLECIFPLIDAGVALVEEGRLKEAVAIYAVVSPSFASTDKLYEAIEKAEPGAVKRFERPPMKPVPTPRRWNSPSPSSGL